MATPAATAPVDEDDSGTWTIRFDDIVLGRKIGEGQFGAVYLGELEGTPVAIKKQLRDLDANVMVYIQRELDTVKRLAHPNIVQFIGLAKHEGAAWVVTEYCSNGDLEHMLYNRSNVLSWAQRVHFALDGVQAVAFLHSKQVMHRDIKSANMLVDEHMKVKLCDFGFATKIDKKLENLAGKKKNKALTIAGTDEWMAPEVILGTPYSFPADVFSFGVTVGEMIMRCKPEARRPRNAFEFEAGEFTAALPVDCPPELSALVLACCVYEPAQRPEAKLIVKGLRELHSQLAARDLTAAASALDVAAAAAAAASPRNVSGTLSSASMPKPDDAYAGLHVSPDDDAPSGLPNERSAMRVFVAFTGRAVPPADLVRHRRRWLALQDVPDTALQGWLEIQLPSAKRKTKLYAALVGDALYYWLKQRKPDVNVGRILIDRSAMIDVEEVGKKKMELRIVGWKGEEYRVQGKRPLLEQWCLALKQAQGSSTLDLNEVYSADAKRPYAHSDMTSSADVLVFCVALRGAAAGDVTPRGGDAQRSHNVLLCVSTDGVRLCAPFLEDILFEFSFADAQKWSIQRNDVCEIVLVNAAATAKKTPRTTMLEFVCQQSENVYAALEACSKGARASEVVLSPRRK